MKNKWTGSLKVKITFIFSILIAIAFGLNWIVALHTMRSEKIHDLEKVLNHLLNESMSDHILQPLTPKSCLSYLYAIPHNKMILNDSEASKLRFLVSKEPYISRENEVVSSVQQRNGIYLYAISNTEKIELALDKYAQKLLLRYLVSLLVILLISIVLLDYYMKPLAVLAKKTREWNNQEPFDFSLGNPGKEIIEVSHAFGMLIHRLEIFRTKEAELFKEAAHELKTPLALMRSRLDVYENNANYPKNKFIVDLGHDIERLTSELKNVLFLESSDFEEPISINLLEVLKAIVRKMDILIQRKQLVLQLQMETFLIVASEKLLSKVLSALLENAITYAKEKSIVKVGCDPVERKVWIDNIVGDEKYLFSSRIGEKMLKRLSHEIGFEYSITQNETFFRIELIFSNDLNLM
ncbi:MAG: HAMP domain-containing sensor histidine kinase [Sulfuricurvum sp.]|nr:HAMP domain-containing sensor histidine kinase [Sulfuricurvum sp.]